MKEKKEQDYEHDRARYDINLQHELDTKKILKMKRPNIYEEKIDNEM